ncbi:DNA adenine methylase [Mycobacteroides abscessus]|uniref:DNA adenine methylase n=1 Tax=Mycobacteroides abscessus TaxID=36809 RepID=UPI001EEE3F2D|nr:DNA adenine methylase [Mycobacteroides abscessus]
MSRTPAPIAPPMAYFGGKTRLARRIADLLPAHGHYVEPFAGSLAVLLAKEPSKMETVNDLDGLLMTFWEVLRDRPDELMRVCALTPHSRAEYLAARDADLSQLDDVEVARLVWLQIAQGRGGTMRQTGWRMFVNPNGSSIPMGDYLEAYVNRMAAAAQRLHHVSLECRPGIEVVEQYGSDPGCCLYVDPPYLGDVRRATGNGYRIEMREPELFKRHMDYWWLVVSDRSIVRPGELPTGWGLLISVGPYLQVSHPAPRLEPEPMPRELLVSLARSVSRTAAGDAFGRDWDQPEAVR